MEPIFLDIARLFVQQLRKGLDLPKFHRYIANHMTSRRSQQNKISLQHDGGQDPTSARRRARLRKELVSYQGIALAMPQACYQSPL
jgi:hypothetical protein